MPQDNLMEGGLRTLPTEAKGAGLADRNGHPDGVGSGCSPHRRMTASSPKPTAQNLWLLEFDMTASSDSI